MKKVKFITLGCKVNQYDTQGIRERFSYAGFKEIYNGKKADIYVINTCTVTSSADSKSRYFIHYAYRRNPKAKIIVTGCYTALDSDKIAKIPGVTHIVKNRDRDKIIEILNGHGKLSGQKRNDETGISNFSGHTRAFLKIQDGCNNRCSYCKVPLARGVSRSKPLDEVLREAEKLVKNGFKEIVLCGICLGSYGKDLQGRGNLIDVIEALEEIGGLLRIRLSSIEAGDVSNALIKKMAESRKLCRHLHIPIQSGDNEILKKMNRNYSRKGYLTLIKKIKDNITGVAITTDVLVGFPGERDENFNHTVDLVREIMPLRAHIFPYSKRPGTPAAILKDEINPIIVKERISFLKGIAGRCTFDYKKQFLNKDIGVLIEERTQADNKYWEGYTDNYIKVRVESDRNLKNQLIKARLKKVYANKDCLEAVFIIK